MKHPRKTHMTAPLVFIMSAWMWTASAILIILALYRVEDKLDLRSFLQDFGGKLLVVGVIVLLCSSILAIRYWHYLQRTRSRPLKVMLIWNFLPLILAITICEVYLRSLATETSTGTILWEKPLAPRSLSEFADGRLLEPLLSYDHTLGWVVKPNSSTSDGLYITAEKGIRKSKASIEFSTKNVTCQIALVGDSHTYGYGLKFEETWGYLLQDYMPECQVLNFGVSGYSVGQMYLRYLRDVVPLHPDIVILALSSHSSSRTMGVYGLTMFSGGMPWWAQPRFQLTNDGLEPINLPLPRPEDILQTKWVADLPYIDYDWHFFPGKWELKQWRYFYNFYLFRLYATRYALSRRQRNEGFAEALNHALLKGFIQAAESHNSIPVLLYLPDKADEKNVTTETPSLNILRSSGFDYLDLRPCLNKVAAEDRFVPNIDHYSMRGGQTIAACVIRYVSSVRRQVEHKKGKH